MSAPATAVPYRLAGRRVEVTGPLDRSGSGRSTAEAVRFLRECRSQGLPVAWRAVAGPSYDIGLLHHLPPPPRELSADEAELAAWRAGHVFGSLHHRRGPAFVTVLDRREKGTAVRLTLDHPDLLAAVLRLQDPAPLDAVVGRPGGRRSPPSRAAGAGRRRLGGGAAPARPAPAGPVHHGLTGPSHQGDENRRSRKRSTRA
ncbi:DUF5825 family protein [Streptomyces sp. NPDC007856]|uniref:DUF5825 family protein n=1 Tax=Streptomyces sp. NPDC007856 TaxID=3364781 RepID=UPI0036766D99